MNPGYFKILGRAPVYLDDSPIEFSLPEFPANSSAQTRAELDYLLELQAKARSPEAVARSQMLAGVFYRVSTQPGDEDYARMRRNLFFTGSELGEWFGPETLPKTADLLARVQSDATYYIWAFKYRFNRARPYEIEPRIERLETPNFPAYPSAHSANSWTAAYVFQELMPEDRDVFARGAAELAYLAGDPRRPLPQRLGIGPGPRAAGRRPAARVPRVPQGPRGGARRDCRREALTEVRAGVSRSELPRNPEGGVFLASRPRAQGASGAQAL